MATKVKNLKGLKFDYEAKDNGVDITSFTLDEIRKMGTKPMANLFLTPKGHPFIFLQNAAGDQEPCSLTMKYRVELFDSLGVKYKTETKNDRIVSVIVDNVAEAKAKVAGHKLSGADVVFYYNTSDSGEDFITVGRPGGAELEEME